jgi:hypothetical protein
MSEWWIGAVAVQYLIAAGLYARTGAWGWALAFASYALANVGLIWASMANRS